MVPSVQRCKVWLTPTTRVPCSNAAKMWESLKFAGVPQTRQCPKLANGSQPILRILHRATIKIRRTTTEIYNKPTTTTVLQPFFLDHTDEPVLEENFRTLFCKGRLTGTDTLIIRLGTTPSGLTSAHHHPPIFYRQGAGPSCHPTNSVKPLNANNKPRLMQRTKFTTMQNNHATGTQKCCNSKVKLKQLKPRFGCNLQPGNELQQQQSLIFSLLLFT